MEKEPQQTKSENYSSTTEAAADNNYLTPAAILVGSIIIAIAILVGGNPSSSTSNARLADSDQGQPIAEAIDLQAVLADAEIDPDELQACAAESRFDDNIQQDIDNAVATGGRGTPWTVVIDTQTGNRYPLGGAYPTDQVLALLDSNFSTLPPEASEGTDLAALRPVDESDYYRGPEDARYVFVEYSDFDCPFCQRFHQTMKDVMAERDDVAWVYRNFPLEQLHPNARAVANAAECVGELSDSDEVFWQFADAYFNQK